MLILWWYSFVQMRVFAQALYCPVPLSIHGSTERLKITSCCQLKKETLCWNMALSLLILFVSYGANRALVHFVIRWQMESDWHTWDRMIKNGSWSILTLTQPEAKNKEMHRNAECTDIGSTFHYYSNPNLKKNILSTSEFDWSILMSREHNLVHISPHSILLSWLHG